MTGTSLKLRSASQSEQGMLHHRAKLTFVRPAQGAPLVRVRPVDSAGYITADGRPILINMLGSRQQSSVTAMVNTLVVCLS
jgi:hypothetical protein